MEELEKQGLILQAIATHVKTLHRSASSARQRDMARVAGEFEAEANRFESIANGLKSGLLQIVSPSTVKNK